MIYYQNDKLLIRSLMQDDIPIIEQAFAQQGWHKPASQYAAYYQQQQKGSRHVFTAFSHGEFAGYVTLLPHAKTGPFASCGFPEISDLNVLIKYQHQGIGSHLMDAAESMAAAMGSVVTLGVGLHSGYGSAQRMYVKRGYLPDGSGVWYKDSPHEPYTPCVNDDDLVLYLSKNFKTV